MIAYLKALASRLSRRGLGTFFPPSADPPAGVREPRKRGPGGRSSTAAVAEPVEQAVVRAYGTVQSRGAATRNADPSDG
jgi:hypothetical protein